MVAMHRVVVGTTASGKSALESRRRWRRESPAMLVEPRFAHLRVFRLCWPGETDRWLQSIRLERPQPPPARRGLA